MNPNNPTIRELKSMEQKRDEFAYSYEYDEHHNCYGCCQSASEYENAVKAGWDACKAECDKENERLKKTIEYQMQKYKELDSTPSDFQIIESLTERCQRLTKALEVAKGALSKNKLNYDHRRASSRRVDFLTNRVSEHRGNPSHDKAELSFVKRAIENSDISIKALEQIDKIEKGEG